MSNVVERYEPRQAQVRTCQLGPPSICLQVHAASAQRLRGSETLRMQAHVGFMHAGPCTFCMQVLGKREVDLGVKDIMSTAQFRGIWASLGVDIRLGGVYSGSLGVMGGGMLTLEAWQLISYTYTWQMWN